MTKFVRRALFLISLRLDQLGRLVMFAALGTMRLDELRAASELRWRGFYVEEAEITSGFMPWESEIVSHAIDSADHVLVIGSGTGRDMLALAEMGCRVTGVEPSEHAIAIARRVLGERGISAPIVHGYFEDVALDGTFDVVDFSWRCYGYIPGSRRRVAALRKAAEHLAPGGRIVVSFRAMGESPVGLSMKVQRAVARICHSDWQLEAGDAVSQFETSVETNPLQIRRGMSLERVSIEHIFTPGQFEAEAAAAGLHAVFHGREALRGKREQWAFVLHADT